MSEATEVDGDADVAQGFGEHHPREASQTRLRQLPDDHRLGEEEDGHPQDQESMPESRRAESIVSWRRLEVWVKLELTPPLLVTAAA